MKNNYVQSIYDNSKKIYKLVTDKKFLKWFYIIFLTSLVIGLVFMIVGLVIPIKPYGLILLLIGICLIPIIIITFYILEYLRRKAFNVYKQKFNFIDLYGSHLYEHKLVDNVFQLDSDFDNIFFRQQLEILSRKYDFVNLHKNYATYKFLINQQSCHLSYCNATVVNKNTKLVSGNAKVFQLIIATDFNQPIEGIMCLKDVYNVQQIDVWKKQTFDKYAIYSNDTLKAWNVVIETANKLMNEKMNLVEIKIKANKIFYAFDFSQTCLLLGLNNVKFYKNTWNELAIQYIDHQLLIKQIFEAIRLQ